MSTFYDNLHIKNTRYNKQISWWTEECKIKLNGTKSKLYDSDKCEIIYSNKIFLGHNLVLKKGMKMLTKLKCVGTKTEDPK